MAISLSQNKEGAVATINWKKLSVTKFLPTPKLFYNRYAFKADMTVGGVWLYRHAHRCRNYTEFAEYVKYRKEERPYSMSRSYSSIETADAKQLYSIYTDSKKYGTQIRIRIEGRHMSICADTEEILFTILSNAKLKDQIYDLYRPLNQEAREKIDGGVLFMSDPKFKYRVMIRGDSYTKEVKEQILSYLNNHQDSLFVSPGVKEKLLRDGNTYISGYFYSDTTDILLFLQIIAPKFTGKIYSIEPHYDK
jgi:hypothetical protein